METGHSRDELKMHGCCQSKKSSICPIILLTLILAFAISTVSLILVYGGFLEITQVEEVCNTSSCIELSAEIRNIINDSVDPCVDFYEFACGKFHAMASERQINNPLRDEHDRIQNILNSYITEPQSEDDSRPIFMQKKYYQSCLRVEESENDPNVIFFNELDKIGGWPFLGRIKWNEDNFDWIDIMSKAREAGLPFQWFLKIDILDYQQYILQISNPPHCVCEHLTPEYHEMQRNALEMLTNPGIDTVSDLNHLKNFELSLCVLCNEVEHKDFIVKSAMLVRNNPWFGMLADNFITAAIGSGNLLRSNFKIAYKGEYIYKLGYLLNRTPKKVLAGYVLWKMIEEFLPYLSEDYREIYANYKSSTLKEDFDRSKFCLEDTKSKFKYVSEVSYIRSHADPSAEDNVKQIVESIKGELLTRVQNVQWNNSQKMENAIEFYKNLQTLIIVSDKLLDDDVISVNSKLDMLDFESTNFTLDILELARNCFKSKMEMIGRTSVNFEAIGKASVDINREQELLILPAFTFHGFLYKDDLPQFYNYAGMGSIVSLELIRSLNLLSNKLEDLHDTFSETRKCLIDNLKNENITFKPYLAFYKNYEALLAQDLSYTAYKKMVETNGEENPIIDLKYSPNQLFWIKSSMSWCYRALTNEDLLHQQIAKYRVNEAAKTSQNFAADFECPPDTPMNPTNKCQLL